MSNLNHLRVAVIGAGIRGTSLARHLSRSKTSVVAVAEPNEVKRAAFSQEFDISENHSFDDWKKLTESEIDCDAVIVATLDNQHTGPALEALKNDWHVLLEKPLSDTLEDCFKIESAQKASGKVLSVCHTLRFMNSFHKVKELVDANIIGEIVHIEHMEGIGHLRFTHNYVRGRWAKESNNTFLLLHKCCHDIDYLCWLIDSPCIRVSSFGSLKFFTPQNAPGHSSRRCSDCLESQSCRYSALKLYTEGSLDQWPARDICQNHTKDAHIQALQEGPYGVCVWHGGNDVVDHQVVMMEFAEGVTATSTLSGYSAFNGRRIRIQGTRGELFFDEVTNKIVVSDFFKKDPEIITFDASNSYHPEDKDIVNDWLSSIFTSQYDVKVDASEALKTHTIVFAAEESRKTNKTIEISDFYKKIRSGENSNQNI